jgi:hypothetical protein
MRIISTYGAVPSLYSTLGGGGRDVPVWAPTLEGQNCERPTQFAHAIIQFALCIMENKYENSQRTALKNFSNDHAFCKPFLLHTLSSN